MDLRPISYRFTHHFQTRTFNELGTKYIDPDSGLIYFKYDFGYEFGIIFPGEGKKFIAGGNKFDSGRSAQLSRNKLIHSSADAIDIPVTHENSLRHTIHGRAHQFNKATPIAAQKYRPQLKPAIAIDVDEFHTNGPIPNRTSIDRGIYCAANRKIFN